MKRPALLDGLIIGALCSGCYAWGFFESDRRERHRLIQNVAGYAATYCTAQHLVTLRQMTRLMEARNRRDELAAVKVRP